MEATSIVTVWDLLRKKVRASEQNEISRIIGTQLISEINDLKEELANIQDIYLEFGGKAKLDSKLLSLEGN